MNHRLLMHAKKKTSNNLYSIFITSGTSLRRKSVRCDRPSVGIFTDVRMRTHFKQGSLRCCGCEHTRFLLLPVKAAPLIPFWYGTLASRKDKSLWGNYHGAWPVCYASTLIIWASDHHRRLQYRVIWCHCTLWPPSIHPSYDHLSLQGTHVYWSRIVTTNCVIFKVDDFWKFEVEFQIFRVFCHLTLPLDKRDSVSGLVVKGFASPFSLKMLYLNLQFSHRRDGCVFVQLTSA